MSPQRSPREAGLTIEKTILAQSNDWALTIVLSPLLARTSLPSSLCSNKRRGLETPEQLGRVLLSTC